MSFSSAMALARWLVPEDRSSRYRWCSHSRARLKPRPSRSFVQICGLVEIVGYDLGAGCQRGFHPWLHGSGPARSRALLGDKTRCNQNGLGLEVLVQDVIAAMVTSPCANGELFSFNFDALRRLQRCFAEFVSTSAVCKRNVETFGQEPHGPADVLDRPDGRYNIVQVEFQRVCEDRIWCIAGPEASSPALWHKLQRGRHALWHRARYCFEIFDGLIINWEEAAGRAIFRRHIGDGGLRLRATGCRESRAVNSTNLPTTPRFWRSISTTRQHKVGRGYAFIQLAGQLEADDFRDQHGNRLAKHGRFRLDAADAPAQARKGR